MGELVSVCYSFTGIRARDHVLHRVIVSPTKLDKLLVVIGTSTIFEAACYHGRVGSFMCYREGLSSRDAAEVASS